jgi:murein DD-endopeptidase MepM/ murein hydrolase activator NlpD
VPGSAEPPAIRDELPQESVAPAQPPRAEAVTLGQAFDSSAFLRAAGLSEADAQRWAKRLQAVTHDARLLPNHTLLLYRAPDTGALRGLRYDLGARTSVVLETLGAGAVLVRPQAIRYQTRRVALALALSRGFSQDVEAHGLSPAMIASIRQAFAYVYPLDFAPPSSVLKVVYEQRMSSDGLYRRPEEFKAASLSAAGRNYVVLRFGDGVAPRIRDEHGRVTGPTFLRYPLRFDYVSSGFSFGRYHPILHRFRPHLGVDLAARYGTPVRAIGDGEIESAQWESELGRCVRVRHADGLVTLYGHLSWVKRDIRPGVRVKAGQVIGLVGSSGLSTGAHLHFAVIKNGRYVNPMTVRLEEANEIPDNLRPRFRSFRQQYLGALNQVEPPYHEVVSVETAEGETPSPSSVRKTPLAEAQNVEQPSVPEESGPEPIMADREGQSRIR